jgi:hypothetical protein
MLGRIEFLLDVLEEVKQKSSTCMIENSHVIDIPTWQTLMCDSEDLEVLDMLDSIRAIKVHHIGDQIYDQDPNIIFSINYDYICSSLSKVI